MIESCTETDIPPLAALMRGRAPLGEAETGALLRRALAQGACLLVYRTEGVPRGFLLWQAAPDGRAMVRHLYVAPGWRRRGIARRLVRRFKAEVAADQPVAAAQSQ